MSAAGLTTRPLERFLHLEATSGIVVLIATGVALVWANSPWGASYTQFWHAPIALRVAGFALERDLAWLVNEGLMIFLFFLAGLEIRREMQQGELADARHAALPVAAALGGMLVPAVLYVLLSSTPELRVGWGVPLATDLAVALGVLSLLGTRVPAPLRVLLLALAVSDALGAIIVIALFYSPGLSFGGLFVGAVGLSSIFLLQRLGVRPWAAYVAPSAVIWAGVSMAGVHPAIAGVIIGLVTPVEARLGPRGFIWRMQRELKMLERANPERLTSPELANTLREVERTRREAMSSADALIELLHPIVAFGILPLFALANAGVSLRGLVFDDSSLQIAGGVAVALVLGKPLGVLLACGLALKFRLAALPAGFGWRQLVVLGALAGVGFTMALFIAQLAFTDPGPLAAARLGVLLAAALASMLALGVGAWLLPSRRNPAEPRSTPSPGPGRSDQENE